MRKSFIGILGVSVAVIIGMGFWYLMNEKDLDTEKINLELGDFQPIPEGTLDETESEIQKRLDEIEKQKNNDTGYVPQPRVWQTSGVFQIDRMQYVLGENVFLRIGLLKPTDKGQIAFLRPLNETHSSVYLTIPFDGSSKESFNFYFKPGLSIQKNICDKYDLIGKWTVVFNGVDYKNLTFEIVDQVVPGQESNYEQAVC